eukprot:COSAG05_NODE_27_length_29281_cov_199.946919_16_plen_95_part_00
MYEARRRNPSIRIYALEWSVPGWVGGNGSIHTAADDYSAANRRYTLNWLRGARDRWNVSTVDFLGFWVITCSKRIDSCMPEARRAQMLLLRHII